MSASAGLLVAALPAIAVAHNTTLSTSQINSSNIANPTTGNCEYSNSQGIYNTELSCRISRSSSQHNLETDSGKSSCSPALLDSSFDSGIVVGANGTLKGGSTAELSMAVKQVGAIGSAVSSQKESIRAKGGITSGSGGADGGGGVTVTGIGTGISCNAEEQMRQKLRYERLQQWRLILLELDRQRDPYRRLRERLSFHIMRQQMKVFEFPPNNKCNNLLAGIAAVVGVIGGVCLLTSGTKTLIDKICERRIFRKGSTNEHICNVCCCQIDQFDSKSVVTCCVCNKKICRGAKCSIWLPKAGRWECQLCQSSKDSLTHTQSWVAEQMSFNRQKYVYPMRARSEIFIPIGDCNESSMHFESVSQVGENSGAITAEQKLKIREYVEEVVAKLLGGSLDQIRVSQLSKSENYLPGIVNSSVSPQTALALNGNQSNNKQNVNKPSEFSEISQTRLRYMIESIIAETMRMPPLANGSASAVALNTHARSNGAIDKLPLENGNLRLRHRPRTDHYFEPNIYQDLLATAVLNKIADNEGNIRQFSESTPDLSSRNIDSNFNIESASSGSSVEPRSDFSYTDNEQSPKISKVAGRESALSDYIAAHTVPLPDLSTAVTESEDDDLASVSSSTIAEGTWEDNWLFRKKRSSLTASRTGSVGMLVPAPKNDVRAQIGDKTTDEISDLSEIGSDTDDSSLKVTADNLDQLNDRILNKHLIGGQNTKVVLDELIETASLISNTPHAPNEPEYTETRNEDVVEATLKTEAINPSVANHPIKEASIAQNPLSASNQSDEDIQDEDGCTGYSVVDMFDEISPDHQTKSTCQGPSVIEILAAIALGPMLAVPASEQPSILTSTELTSLKELSDIALAEIKSRGPERGILSLDIIDEEDEANIINITEDDENGNNFRSLSTPIVSDAGKGFISEINYANAEEMQPSESMKYFTKSHEGEVVRENKSKYYNAADTNVIHNTTLKENAIKPHKETEVHKGIAEKNELENTKPEGTESVKEMGFQPIITTVATEITNDGKLETKPPKYAAVIIEVPECADTLRHIANELEIVVETQAAAEATYTEASKEAESHTRRNVITIKSPSSAEITTAETESYANPDTLQRIKNELGIAIEVENPGATRIQEVPIQVEREITHTLKVEKLIDIKSQVLTEKQPVVINMEADVENKIPAEIVTAKASTQIESQLPQTTETGKHEELKKECPDEAIAQILQDTKAHKEDRPQLTLATEEDNQNAVEYHTIAEDEVSQTAAKPNAYPLEPTGTELETHAPTEAANDVSPLVIELQASYFSVNDEAINDKTQSSAELPADKTQTETKSNTLPLAVIDVQTVVEPQTPATAETGHVSTNTHLEIQTTSQSSQNTIKQTVIDVKPQVSAEVHITETQRESLQDIPQFKSTEQVTRVETQVLTTCLTREASKENLTELYQDTGTLKEAKSQVTIASIEENVSIVEDRVLTEVLITEFQSESNLDTSHSVETELAIANETQDSAKENSEKPSTRPYSHITQSFDTEKAADVESSLSAEASISETKTEAKSANPLLVENEQADLQILKTALDAEGVDIKTQTTTQICSTETQNQDKPTRGPVAETQTNLQCKQLTQASIDKSLSEGEKVKTPYFETENPSGKSGSQKAKLSIEENTNINETRVLASGRATEVQSNAQLKTFMSAGTAPEKVREEEDTETSQYSKSQITQTYNNKTENIFNETSTELEPKTKKTTEDNGMIDVTIQNLKKSAESMEATEEIVKRTRTQPKSKNLQTTEDERVMADTTRKFLTLATEVEDVQSQPYTEVPISENHSALLPNIQALKDIRMVEVVGAPVQVKVPIRETSKMPQVTATPKEIETVIIGLSIEDKANVVETQTLIAALVTKTKPDTLISATIEPARVGEEKFTEASMQPRNEYDPELPKLSEMEREILAETELVDANTDTPTTTSVESKKETDLETAEPTANDVGTVAEIQVPTQEIDKEAPIQTEPEIQMASKEEKAADANTEIPTTTSVESQKESDLETAEPTANDVGAAAEIQVPTQEIDKEAPVQAEPENQKASKEEKAVDANPETPTTTSVEPEKESALETAQPTATDIGTVAEIQVPTEEIDKEAPIQPEPEIQKPPKDEKAVDANTETPTTTSVESKKESVLETAEPTATDVGAVTEIQVPTEEVDKEAAIQAEPEIQKTSKDEKAVDANTETPMTTSVESKKESVLETAEPTATDVGTVAEIQVPTQDIYKEAPVQTEPEIQKASKDGKAVDANTETPMTTSVESKKESVLETAEPTANDVGTVAEIQVPTQEIDKEAPVQAEPEIQKASKEEKAVDANIETPTTTSVEAEKESALQSAEPTATDIGTVAETQVPTQEIDKEAPVKAEPEIQRASKDEKAVDANTETPTTTSVEPEKESALETAQPTATDIGTVAEIQVPTEEIDKEAPIQPEPEIQKAPKDEKAVDANTETPTTTSVESKKESVLETAEPTATDVGTVAETQVPTIDIDKEAPVQTEPDIQKASKDGKAVDSNIETSTTTCGESKMESVLETAEPTANDVGTVAEIQVPTQEIDKEAPVQAEPEIQKASKEEKAVDANIETTTTTSVESEKESALQSAEPTATDIGTVAETQVPTQEIDKEAPVKAEPEIQKASKDEKAVDANTETPTTTSVEPEKESALEMAEHTATDIGTITKIPLPTEETDKEAPVQAEPEIPKASKDEKAVDANTVTPTTTSVEPEKESALETVEPTPTDIGTVAEIQVPTEEIDKEPVQAEPEIQKTSRDVKAVDANTDTPTTTSVEPEKESALEMAEHTATDIGTITKIQLPTEETDKEAPVQAEPEIQKAPTYEKAVDANPETPTTTTVEPEKESALETTEHTATDIGTVAEIQVPTEEIDKEPVQAEPEIQKTSKDEKAVDANTETPTTTSVESQKESALETPEPTATNIGTVAEIQVPNEEIDKEAPVQAEPEIQKASKDENAVDANTETPTTTSVEPEKEAALVTAEPIATDVGSVAEIQVPTEEIDKEAPVPAELEIQKAPNDEKAVDANTETPTTTSVESQMESALETAEPIATDVGSDAEIQVPTEEIDKEAPVPAELEIQKAPNDEKAVDANTETPTTNSVESQKESALETAEPIATDVGSDAEIQVPTEEIDKEPVQAEPEIQKTSKDEKAVDANTETPTTTSVESQKESALETPEPTATNIGTVAEIQVPTEGIDKEAPVQAEPEIQKASKEENAVDANPETPTTTTVEPEKGSALETTEHTAIDIGTVPEIQLPTEEIDKEPVQAEPETQKTSKDEKAVDANTEIPTTTSVESQKESALETPEPTATNIGTVAEIQVATEGIDKEAPVQAEPEIQKASKDENAVDANPGTPTTTTVEPEKESALETAEHTATDIGTVAEIQVPSEEIDKEPVQAEPESQKTSKDEKAVDANTETPTTTSVEYKKESAVETAERTATNVGTVTEIQVPNEEIDKEAPVQAEPEIQKASKDENAVDANTETPTTTSVEPEKEAALVTAEPIATDVGSVAEIQVPTEEIDKEAPVPAELEIQKAPNDEKAVDANTETPTTTSVESQMESALETAEPLATDVGSDAEIQVPTEEIDKEAPVPAELEIQKAPNDEKAVDANTETPTTNSVESQKESALETAEPIATDVGSDAEIQVPTEEIDKEAPVQAEPEIQKAPNDEKAVDANTETPTTTSVESQKESALETAEPIATDVGSDAEIQVPTEEIDKEAPVPAELEIQKAPNDEKAVDANTETPTTTSVESQKESALETAEPIATDVGSVAEIQVPTEEIDKEAPVPAELEIQKAPNDEKAVDANTETPTTTSVESQKESALEMAEPIATDVGSDAEIQVPTEEIDKEAPVQAEPEIPKASKDEKAVDANTETPTTTSVESQKESALETAEPIATDVGSDAEIQVLTEEIYKEAPVPAELEIQKAPNDEKAVDANTETPTTTSVEYKKESAVETAERTATDVGTVTEIHVPTEEIDKEAPIQAESEIQKTSKDEKAVDANTETPTTTSVESKKETVLETAEPTATDVGTVAEIQVPTQEIDKEAPIQTEPEIQMASKEEKAADANTEIPTTTSVESQKESDLETAEPTANDVGTVAEIQVPTQEIDKEAPVQAEPEIQKASKDEKAVDAKTETPTTTSVEFKKESALETAEPTATDVGTVTEIHVPTEEIDKEAPVQAEPELQNASKDEKAVDANTETPTSVESQKDSALEMAEPTATDVDTIAEIEVPTEEISKEVPVQAESEIQKTSKDEKAVDAKTETPTTTSVEFKKESALETAEPTATDVGTVTEIHVPTEEIDKEAPVQAEPELQNASKDEKAVDANTETPTSTSVESQKDSALEMAEPTATDVGTVTEIQVPAEEIDKEAPVQAESEIEKASKDEKAVDANTVTPTTTSVEPEKEPALETAEPTATDVGTVTEIQVPTEEIDNEASAQAESEIQNAPKDEKAVDANTETRTTTSVEFQKDSALEMAEPTATDVGTVAEIEVPTKEIDKEAPVQAERELQKASRVVTVVDANTEPPTTTSVEEIDKDAPVQAQPEIQKESKGENAVDAKTETPTTTSVESQKESALEMAEPTATDVGCVAEIQVPTEEIDKEAPVQTEPELQKVSRVVTVVDANTEPPTTTSVEEIDKYAPVQAQPEIQKESKGENALDAKTETPTTTSVESQKESALEMAEPTATDVGCVAEIQVPTEEIDKEAPVQTEPELQKVSRVVTVVDANTEPPTTTSVEEIDKDAPVQAEPEIQKASKDEKAIDANTKTPTTTSVESQKESALEMAEPTATDVGTVAEIKVPTAKIDKGAPIQAEQEIQKASKDEKAVDGATETPTTISVEPEKECTLETAEPTGTDIGTVAEIQVPTEEIDKEAPVQAESEIQKASKDEKAVDANTETRTTTSVESQKDSALEMVEPTATDVGTVAQIEVPTEEIDKEAPVHADHEIPKASDIGTVAEVQVPTEEIDKEAPVHAGQEIPKASEYEMAVYAKTKKKSELEMVEPAATGGTTTCIGSKMEYEVETAEPNATEVGIVAETQIQTAEIDKEALVQAEPAVQKASRDEKAVYANTETPTTTCIESKMVYAVETVESNATLVETVAEIQVPTEEIDEEIPVQAELEIEKASEEEKALDVNTETPTTTLVESKKEAEVETAEPTATVADTQVPTHDIDGQIPAQTEPQNKKTAEDEMAVDANTETPMTTSESKKEYELETSKLTASKVETVGETQGPTMEIDGETPAQAGPGIQKVLEADRAADLNTETSMTLEQKIAVEGLSPHNAEVAKQAVEVDVKALIPTPVLEAPFDAKPDTPQPESIILSETATTVETVTKDVLRQSVSQLQKSFKNVKAIDIETETVDILTLIENQNETHLDTVVMVESHSVDGTQSAISMPNKVLETETLTARSDTETIITKNLKENEPAMSQPSTIADKSTYSETKDSYIMTLTEPALGAEPPTIVKLVPTNFVQEIFPIVVDKTEKCEVGKLAYVENQVPAATEFIEHPEADIYIPTAATIKSYTSETLNKISSEDAVSKDISSVSNVNLNTSGMILSNTLPGFIRPMAKRLCRQSHVVDTTSSDEDCSQRTISHLATMCKTFIKDKRLLAALEKQRRQTEIMQNYLRSIDSFETEFDYEHHSECLLPNQTFILSTPPPPPPIDDTTNESDSYFVKALSDCKFNFLNDILFSDQLSTDSNQTDESTPTTIESLLADYNNEQDLPHTNTFNNSTSINLTKLTNGSYLSLSPSKSFNISTNIIQDQNFINNNTEHQQNINREDDNDDDDVVLLRHFVPGSIAEREYKKWNNAVEMPNNPYAPEALKRRISGSQERFIDLPNINSSTEKQQISLLETTKSENNAVDGNRSDIDYMRYSRDYYINDEKVSKNSPKHQTIADDCNHSSASISDEPTADIAINENTSQANETQVIEKPIEPHPTLYQALPAHVVEENASIETLSNQSMQSVNTTTSDDSDTVRIYDFKKQQTIIVRNPTKTSAASSIESLPADPSEPTLRATVTISTSIEDSPPNSPKKRRPTDFPLETNMNSSSVATVRTPITPTRGSTPIAFKFLQPKRKLIEPSQILSVDEGADALTISPSAERAVVEEEVAQVMPSVKALAQAFLLTSNKSTPAEKRWKKGVQNMPSVKPNIKQEGIRKIEAHLSIAEVAEDARITSDPSSLNIDPSTSTDHSTTKSSADLPPVPPSPISSSSSDPSPKTEENKSATNALRRVSMLKSNIAFFENLKFK